MTNGRRNRGFTLVELLVVIAIVAILIALLLPAIQAARESSRRSMCNNNLKQMAVAFQNHHDVHGHFPTGGWGFNWIGEPDRGFHRKQPGGWVYNILPYIEQADLHALGAGLNPTTMANYGGTKQTLQMILLTTQLPLIICPSRRDAVVTYPKASFDIFNWDQGLGADVILAKSDYAACAGDPVKPDSGGPNRANSGNPFLAADLLAVPAYTGISFQLSEIPMKKVLDGTSKTYMVGEKYLNPQSYAGSALGGTFLPAPKTYTGNNWYDVGDNECAYTGFNYDLFRSTYYTAGPPVVSYAPQQDTFNAILANIFGSAHAGSFNMAFCDGSVRAIDYGIDPTIHHSLGVRNDGAPVDTSGY